MHGLFVALALLAPLPAAAQTPDAKLDKELAKYDPAAVKAALHYAQVFNMKSVLAQTVAPVRDAIVKTVRQKNPGIDESTLKEFTDTFVRVLYVENSEFFERYTIRMLLETFSTEEIVALDKFYSSDIGRSVLKKTPQLMARLPEFIENMQKEIVPVAREKALKALRAKGKIIRT